MVFCHSTAEQDDLIPQEGPGCLPEDAGHSVVSGCVVSHPFNTLPPFPALAHLPLSARGALAVSFHLHVLDTPATVNLPCVGRCEAGGNSHCSTAPILLGCSELSWACSDAQ